LKFDFKSNLASGYFIDDMAVFYWSLVEFQASNSLLIN